MKVRIIEVKSKKNVTAIIREGISKELPSIHDNWTFNFNKQLRSLKNSKAFILETEEEPGVVQGCMIFQMIDKEIPNLAFIEVAPHNRNEVKKYDHIAGCLIAFAFKQSLLLAKGDYNGLLFLDVKEEDVANQNKLMSVYSSKYNAELCGETTMLISDEGGRHLIEKYLKDN